MIDAIKQHKSVLRTSQALQISQPALTRTLQKVDAMVGGELFVRHSRGMHVNDIGMPMTAGAQPCRSPARDPGRRADGRRARPAASPRNRTSN